jgi:trimethylamine--corrinoid protein Co-methyltransferase
MVSWRAEDSFMRTMLQVLSADEIARVHECTLEILAETGVRVETALGRKYLNDAGAEVDEGSHVVRFPKSLVEESLKLAPKEFTLGARRPGWDLKMNAGKCTLCADGSGTTIYDWKTEEFRPSTYKDWLNVTKLLDAVDEIGVYWTMVDWGLGEATIQDSLKYWMNLFSNFSKHVQDGIERKDLAPWLLETLQIVFGSADTIRKTHPFSFLVCPQSPLTIDEQYTDAYLAVTGYRIPLAVMPMPLMGGTGPGTMISMVILGNCEVLAMLCLLQAVDPGTPFIYAPALATMNPRTGLLASGTVESSVMAVAAVQMARHYRLPVIASGGGSDHFRPGIQASYERAANDMISVLAWPDIMIGPGLLGGSMILSPEQLLIDVEIYRMARKAYQGISTDEEEWLDDVIQRVGPGGHFMGERSTRDALRHGEWYLSQMGTHGTLKEWQEAGRPTILEETHELVAQLLKENDPLPLPEDVVEALNKLGERLDGENHG